jgi:hypothetical protein
MAKGLAETAATSVTDTENATCEKSMFVLSREVEVE